MCVPGHLDNGRDEGRWGGKVLAICQRAMLELSSDRMRQVIYSHTGSPRRSHSEPASLSPFLRFQQLFLGFEIHERSVDSPSISKVVRASDPFVRPVLAGADGIEFA